MYDLTIPVSALTLVFYLIAFSYASVGPGAGPYMNSARFVPHAMQKILSSVMVVAFVLLRGKIINLYL
jgi:hypothetical protein